MLIFIVDNLFVYRISCLDVLAVVVAECCGHVSWCALVAAVRRCVLCPRDAPDQLLCCPRDCCVVSSSASRAVHFLTFTDELVNEKEKYKSITDELDQTFSELSGY